MIKDYGTTVAPDLYMRALQGHPYIPQADQCIRNIVRDYRDSRPSDKHDQVGIMDVGCGPGRLTFSFAHRLATVVGMDASRSFFQYAQRQLLVREQTLPGQVDFINMDFIGDPALFPNYDDPVDADGKWHILVAQGVLHHIHGDDRAAFMKRFHEVLRDDGIVIIGDEFIPKYTTPEMRRLNVAAFYLHIIDEAVKGGFKELAVEESKNFIDDVLSGEKGCGYADTRLLNYIQAMSKSFNREFSRGLDSPPPDPSTKKRLEQFIRTVREEAEKLADLQPSNSFNRGDYKVSVDTLVEEMMLYGFVCKDRYEMGPVQQLGGMGVLVFTKN